MKAKISAILEKNLESLENGSLTLEEVLANHPEHASELIELIETSNWVKNSSTSQPSQRFRKDADARFQNTRFESEQSVTKSPLFRLPMRRIKPKKRRYAYYRIVLGSIAATLLIWGTAVAANVSRPGDALYPLDLALEELQLRRADSAQAASLIRIGLAEERLLEAEALLAVLDEGHFQEALALYAQTVRELSQDFERSRAETLEEASLIFDSALPDHNGRLNVLVDSASETVKSGLEETLDVLDEFENLLNEALPIDVSGSP